MFHRFWVFFSPLQNIWVISNIYYAVRIYRKRAASELLLWHHILQCLQSPSLQALKARRDGAGGSPAYGQGWHWVGFEVPSNSSRFVVPYNT